MPVLARTRTGRGYRTTIPREVRKLLGIGESDEAEWVFEDGKVIVRKRMISCPYCDFEGGLRLIKTWRYRFYDVTPSPSYRSGFLCWGLGRYLSMWGYPLASSDWR
jgi:bifunctional DNA-binding transcriptional regulator/antitoxin component of YhaV-PrlF toxin-antitoxin module